MALTAGVTAFRRTWSNPFEAYLTDAFAARQQRFARLWAYYDNSVFEDLAAWEAYKAAHVLYREVRSIYNPTRRLCDLFAGLIYPGVLSVTGEELPDGVPLAVPLAEDIDPALADAIGQAWQWSAWQQSKGLYVRYGAAVGSVLLGLVDDVERGKVWYEVIWPGFIKELELDGAGNLQMIWLEYDVLDPDRANQRYTYGKRVDKETIKTFKDGRPFDYDGDGAERPTLYPFVPYRFVRHQHTGGQFGAPAIDGSIGTIDELNSLASQVHDAAGRQSSFPTVFWADGDITTVDAGGGVQRANTVDLTPGAIRQEVPILQGPAGGRVDSLASTLNLADGMRAVDALTMELEKKHALLNFWQQLRGMSEVTGPGVLALMGDAVAPVWEAAANYDEGLVRMGQMQAATAGERIKRGHWGRALSRQQEKFRGFDFDSYERGDLDFDVMPRAIIPQSDRARADVALVRGQAMQALTSSGFSTEEAAREVFGWDDARLAIFGRAQVEAIRSQQIAAQADTLPAGLSQ